MDKMVLSSSMSRIGERIVLTFAGVQIQTPNKEVIITNDGATILDKLELAHPAAKMVLPALHCLLVPSVHFGFTILAVRGALEGPRC
jgi:hypothetical protein